VTLSEAIDELLELANDEDAGAERHKAAAHLRAAKEWILQAETVLTFYHPEDHGATLANVAILARAYRSAVAQEDAKADREWIWPADHEGGSTT
jgi:hypothetical protein